ncbi:MAG: HAMP domain-containing histidine kinase [Saprospiraceae bacterium]|nr:HAMP domain-containing histidine kinase [Saprospiraceae bacterium]
MEYISDSSQSAANLLDGMTDMMQFGNEEKLDLGATGLHLLIEEAMVLNEKRAAEKGVHLQFEGQLDSQQPWVRVDAKWMVRALDNLISNALKFSQKGGYIKISYQQDGDEVVLRIADNGIGIPDDTLLKLFTKDAAPSRTGTAGEQGTGLGLSIVKQIIEMQAGEIGVTSTEGLGSIIEIRLPMANL